MGELPTIGASTIFAVQLQGAKPIKDPQAVRIVLCYEPMAFSDWELRP